MIRIQSAAVATFSALLISCERVELDPPNSPPDPFLDKPTYQGVLNHIAPDEWIVVAFDRAEKSPDNPDLAGIVLALSKHKTKDEFLFLYHFLGGRNDAGYTVAGAKGSPQPVAIDAFSPTKFEWKSRNVSLLDTEGYWKTHSEKIGKRYPVYGAIEDIRVSGRFGNYDVQILFHEASKDWEFAVEEFDR